jgi:hypothetical protein
MRLNYSDHDIDALLLEQVSVFEHLIGFTDAGSGTDVHT